MPHSEGYQTPRGRSLLEMLQEQFNIVSAEIELEGSSDRRPFLNGKLEGISIALTIFLNPYAPKSETAARLNALSESTDESVVLFKADEWVL